MIDREARTATAELLRHFMAGLITNDELQDRLPRRSGDPAVREVGKASWYLYSDLREYRLVGKDKASPAVRAVVARWIAFLHTDREYEFPVVSTLSRLGYTVLNLATVGIAGAIWRRRHRAEIENWPFARPSDLADALKSPRLLAGAS